MSRDNTKARESIFEEDLAKNVSLNLHKSFSLNRESKVEALPNQAKRLQEEGMDAILRTTKSLRRVSSDDEDELLRQIKCRMHQGPAPQGRGARSEQDAQCQILEI